MEQEVSNSNPRKSKPNGTSHGNTTQKKIKLDENSTLYTEFSKYQHELDSRNDKYERLVKLSRDITIQSKRIIFSLLRREESTEKLVEDAEVKFKSIKKLLQQISAETKNEDPYKFARAVSPGIQEFIEALTLHYYIKDKRVITYEEAKQLFFVFDGCSVLLTQYDFMLGVADLTGELMRMAINRIGSREFAEAESICGLLRLIHQEFSVFRCEHREMNKKVSVMKTSLKKVETACYNVKVRGSEVPDNLLADMAVGGDSCRED